MPVTKIELTKPIFLQTPDDPEALLYLTHTVWTDAQDEPFALIVDYSQEDTLPVWPAQFDNKTGEMVQVSDEVSKAIGEYLHEHPLSVPSYEEVKEAALHGTEIQ